MNANMEWERTSFYCDTISQSIQLQPFQPQFSGNQSPIAKRNNQEFHLKPIPQEFFCQTPSLFGDFAISESQMSMDAQILGNRYKCFNCFGSKKESRLYQKQICEECRGAEYIYDNNPFINILQRVLNAHMSLINVQQSDQRDKQDYPILKVSEEQNNPEDYRARQSKSTIQYQDQPNLIIQLPTQGEVHNKRQQNRVVPTDNIKNLLLRPSYIKKISQEAQEQQVYAQKEGFYCNICAKQIEECYEQCKDCKEIGVHFRMCHLCAEDNVHHHDVDHYLTLKTIERPLILRKVFSKESTNGSKAQIFQVNNCLQNSIVYIEASLDMIQSGTSLNATFMKGIKVNPQNINTKMKNPQRQQYSNNPPQQWLQEYDMDCSIELHYKNIQPSSKLTETNTNKYVNKRCISDQLCFNDYYCDICKVSPIKHVRYQCKECQNYDLCQVCYDEKRTQHHHSLFQSIMASDFKRKQHNVLFQSIHIQAIHSTNRSQLLI